MAEYCRQCCEFMDMGTEFMLPEGMCKEDEMTSVLCEGCGACYVDHKCNRIPHIVNMRDIPDKWTTLEHEEKRQIAAYVGRRSTGMSYGNPFTHLKSVAEKNGLIRVTSREEAVECYREWLEEEAPHHLSVLMARNDNKLEEQRKWILAHLDDLRWKHLFCWCSPERCHGEVLIDMAHPELKGA